MQQSHYNKINLAVLGLVIFCTIVSLMVVLFVVPAMSFDDGLIRIDTEPYIHEDVIEDLTDKIYAMESVTTFKETFPDFRETVNEIHGIEYVLQARNPNTGNVLSLDISYYPTGSPGSSDKLRASERLSCIPGEEVFGPEEYVITLMNIGGDDLFLHERIKSTDCLDDDWKPVMVIDE